MKHVKECGVLFRADLVTAYWEAHRASQQRSASHLSRAPRARLGRLSLAEQRRQPTDLLRVGRICGHVAVLVSPAAALVAPWARRITQQLCRVMVELGRDRWDRSPADRHPRGAVESPPLRVAPADAPNAVAHVRLAPLSRRDGAVATGHPARGVPARHLRVRDLLTRRARNTLGTATQCTRRNDSPPPPRPRRRRRRRHWRRGPRAAEGPRSARPCRELSLWRRGALEGSGAATPPPPARPRSGTARATARSPALCHRC
jgi:hypothetical protein